MIERSVDPISIDVGALAQRSVATLYSNLVTRPTGRAVRQAIEQQLAVGTEVAISLIDFTEVRILDFSCADEVVAKLVIRYLDPSRPRNAYFLFRAVEELHAHAVEEVLKRQRLAAVCDVGAGRFQLLGSASAEERWAWAEIEVRRRLAPAHVEDMEQGGASDSLASLTTRRLILRDTDGGATALSTLVAAG